MSYRRGLLHFLIHLYLILRRKHFAALPTGTITNAWVAEDVLPIVQLDAFSFVTYARK
jgi:hypothetical protein